jgi:hypothetical protein
MKTLVLALVFAVLSVVTPSCKTPGSPPPTDVGSLDGGVSTPAPVNCISGVASQAIADAQARAITVISNGVTSSSAESVILKNLEGLAYDLIPGALECALRYLGIKLDYDAAHATGPVATEKMAEAKIARAYIRKHEITFTAPPTN